MIKNSLVILALALGSFTPGHAEQKFQSHDSIYELVKDTVARNINTAAEYEISVLPLDSQLKLPECTEALEAFTTTDLIKAGRASIGVRCNAEKKWSIFTSVVIKVYETVIVLSRPVQRGEIITRQHLAIEKRDVSKLRGDFVTQAEQIENKQAARQMPGRRYSGFEKFYRTPAHQTGRQNYYQRHATRFYYSNEWSCDDGWHQRPTYQN